jgi:hypothetical protein
LILYFRRVQTFLDVAFGAAEETHVTVSELSLRLTPHCAVRSRLYMPPAGTLHADALVSQPPRRNSPVRDETS